MWTTDSFSPRRSDFLETLLDSQPEITAAFISRQEISRSSQYVAMPEKSGIFQRSRTTEHGGDWLISRAGNIRFEQSDIEQNG